MAKTIENSELYEVRKNSELGRYLVAARDIEERTLILTESPLVHGPADDDRDLSLGEKPMCLGCCARMERNVLCHCSKCGWPVCGRQCEQIQIHAENECQLFQSEKVDYPPPHTWPIINKSVLVLRCLLIRQRKPDVWKHVICALVHHTERRYKKPYCVKGDEMLLENISYFLRRTSQQDKQDIVQLSGVINVNAFSTTNIYYNRIAQCIYSEASLLSNSCVPNATWRIGPCPFFEIRITSTTHIKKGQMITIAYSSHENFAGTLQRQISNEDVAHFVCCCLRCRDPTEYGTFVSAIRCPNCYVHYILPLNSLDLDSWWKCQECEETQSVQKVVLQVHNFQQKYDAIKMKKLARESEILQLEDLLTDANKSLHSNHYILQEVRMHIVKKQISYLECLTKEELYRLILHIQLLLNIANVLAPGYSQIRALLQHFLAQGLLTKLKKNWLNESDERDTLAKMVYFLQTRALLFFQCHNSSAQNDRLIASIQQGLNKLSESGINV